MHGDFAYSIANMYCAVCMYTKDLFIPLIVITKFSDDGFSLSKIDGYHVPKLQIIIISIQ